MIGQQQQAVEALSLETKLKDDVKFKFETLATGLESEEAVGASLIQSLNLSAVLMCGGNLE